MTLEPKKLVGKTLQLFYETKGNGDPAIKSMLEEINKGADAAADALTKEERDIGKQRVSEYDLLLNGIINCLEEVKCGFCQGWGHKAKRCATLLAINRKTSDMPGMKAAWGKRKGQYLKSVFDSVVPDSV